MLRVVIFSGGRGSNNLVKEFLDFDLVNLSLIVNAYDDGKSTGEIRKFFKMLGPSDIRKNQENIMSRQNPNFDTISRIFGYRFPKDADYEECFKTLQDFAEGRRMDLAGIEIEDKNLKEVFRSLLQSFLSGIELYGSFLGERFRFNDCSVANCLYAGAYDLCGKDFTRTIDLFNILLNVRCEVIPTNLENKKLIAIRETGELCYNEADIVELRTSKRVQDIFLVNEYPVREQVEALFTSKREKHEYLERIACNVHATAKTLDALSQADIIIYSAGTQHSSLYPSYMTLGVADAIYNNTNALKVFIANIGEDYETPDYSASELVLGAYKYLKKNCKLDLNLRDMINVALVNTARSEAKDEFRYVKNDFGRLDELKINVYYDNFECSENLGKHDGKKTVDTILKIYYENFYHKILTKKSHTLV